MPRLLYLTCLDSPDPEVESLILPALQAEAGGPFSGLDICRVSSGMALNWEDEPQELKAGAWSHCLVCGPIDRLREIGQELPISQLGCPTYAWAGIPTPFLDYHLADTACYYDFFVTYSTMAAAAYKALLQGIENPSKQVFKAAFETRTVRPAVDCRTFRPVSNYGKDYSRAELRQALFSRPVTDKQLLVSCIDPQDLPTALASTRLLAEKVDRPVWLFLQTREQPADLQALTDGSEIQNLIVRQDRLSPAERHRLYCASDLYLCTDYAGSWPYRMVEAQASGCVVAGPNDHTWLECLDGERGVELPADLFDREPGGRYCRRVLPGQAAESIRQALTTEQFKTLRETAISWAHVNTEPTVGRCVQDWRRLFGFK